MWANDKKEGRGTLTDYQDGMPDYLIHGNWKDDEFDGLATHVYEGRSVDVVYKMGEVAWNINLGTKEEGIAPESPSLNLIKKYANEDLMVLEALKAEQELVENELFRSKKR